jgi:hypothetical protein
MRLVSNKGRYWTILAFYFVSQKQLNYHFNYHSNSHLNMIWDKLASLYRIMRETGARKDTLNEITFYVLKVTISLLLVRLIALFVSIAARSVRDYLAFYLKIQNTIMNSTTAKRFKEKNGWKKFRSDPKRKRKSHHETFDSIRYCFLTNSI